MWKRHQPAHLKPSRRRLSVRLLGAITGAALAAVVGFVHGAGTATASTGPAAHLIGRAAGNNFTASPLLVRSSAAGQKLMYAIIVANDSSSEQSYRVDLACTSYCFTTATVYVGLTPVSGPFFTPRLGPGEEAGFTVQVSAPANAPPLSDDQTLLLSSADGSTLLDTVHLIYSVAANAGTRADDVFIAQGGQPQVGGDNYELAASQAIKPGTAATFSVMVKNNTSAATNVTLLAQPYQGCVGYRLRVTQGISDVTNAVLAGTYSVHLPAHGFTTLSAEVKHTSPITSPACAVDGWTFHATAPSNPASDALLLVPDGTAQ